jgi:hypothetical protein
MNWTTAAAYILNRLKEKSTWVSLGSVLTGMGVVIAPDKWQLIMAVGMGLPGIVGVFLPARVQEANIVPAANGAPTSALAQSLSDKQGL